MGEPKDGRTGGREDGRTGERENGNWAGLCCGGFDMSEVSDTSGWSDFPDLMGDMDPLNGIDEVDGLNRFGNTHPATSEPRNPGTSEPNRLT
jgi:hypothetical protein